MFIQSFTSSRPLWAEGVESGRGGVAYLRAAHQLPASLPLRVEHNGRTLADMDARYRYIFQQINQCLIWTGIG